MTLDKLAMMVASGFEHIDQRFTGVDENFKKIAENFTKVEENFKKVRRDILETHDTFVTKDEMRKVISRVEVLERSIKKH